MSALHLRSSGSEAFQPRFHYFQMRDAQLFLDADSRWRKGRMLSVWELSERIVIVRAPLENTPYCKSLTLKQ